MARILYLKTPNRDFSQRMLEKCPDLTLGEFLAATGCEPVARDPGLFGDRLGDFQVMWVQGGASAPPPKPVAAAAPAGGNEFDALWAGGGVPPAAAPVAARAPAPVRPAPAPEEIPDEMSDEIAVYHAYHREIVEIGKSLDHGLSVLVIADKILVEHLLRQIGRSTVRALVRDDDGAGAQAEPAAAPRRDLGSRVESAMDPGVSRVQAIGRRLNLLKSNEALVLRNLDLITTVSQSVLTSEAKQLAEILYWRPDKVLVGFADPALEIPEIIRKRFPIRVEVVSIAKQSVPRMVTRRERAKFKDFDANHLYKNVSGLNAVEFRNAMRYITVECADGTPSRRIFSSIRLFKGSQSSEVQIPDITFEDIGGYGEVKGKIDEVIRLMSGEFDGADERTERIAQELVPRGVLFHGPPGTGKTLFSKAIANRLNATIQIVSGPEIMSKFVGESEERVRHIFAVARKNAPAVIVFDEFDSIAFHRGSAGDDGAGRASNAVVAQLLTEMDGFRGDQQVLIVATTNRPDIIDVAFLRPSRLTPIEIPLPDDDARRRIIEIYLKRFDIARAPEIEACLDRLVARSAGFNGDDLQSLFRDAKRAELLHQVAVTAEGLLRLAEGIVERKTHGRRQHL